MESEGEMNGEEDEDGRKEDKKKCFRIGANWGTEMNWGSVKYKLVEVWIQHDKTKQN